ncbi:hypothetical protein SAMN05421736_101788 [Evansella caseinilytica]|uniref:CAAX prenyl protease 2/Lysostaphin resistance protein A-like domain-containing protein n=1 Tax=Evansella caseinilytica TaxID=1503961 RepID=A0A1H3ICJ8_9BACI|nr:type II CAAX endopeptidase family protein [Evansella caseinilytica]SDY25583.1 hypothetical protein SAMN05421736_101788 [Evansella caseinilytica]
MTEKSFTTKGWSWKELILLLFLTLVLVPVFIENLMYNAFNCLFQNSLFAGAAMGLTMAVVFTAGVYYIALKPHKLLWDAVGIRVFQASYWKAIIGWTAVLFFVSVLLLTAMDWLNIGWENEKTQSLQSEITWLTISVGFVSAAIISPAYEEIFYRGFLYKWLRMKWGVGTGVLISSVIFTVVHIPTYNTLPINFISGAVWAWTYEKSGSILPGMIIHGIYNGIAVLLTVWM